MSLSPTDRSAHGAAPRATYAAGEVQARLADVPERERGLVAGLLNDSHVFPVYWYVAIAVGRRRGGWVVDGPFAARTRQRALELVEQAAADLADARIVGPVPVTALRRQVGLG